jgi:two-component system cell cycle response regulator
VRTHIELKNARITIDRHNHELACKNDDLEKANAELKKALKRIRSLEGILPICSYCNKIRDEEGSWYQLETYISQHSSAKFSHGICPACIRRYHPELGEE